MAKYDLSKYEVQAVSDKKNPNVWIDFSHAEDLQVTRNKLGLAASLLGQREEYLGKITKKGTFEPTRFNLVALTTFDLRAIANKIE